MGKVILYCTINWNHSIQRFFPENFCKFKELCQNCVSMKNLGLTYSCSIQYKKLGWVDRLPYPLPALKRTNLSVHIRVWDERWNPNLASSLSLMLFDLLNFSSASKTIVWYTSEHLCEHLCVHHAQLRTFEMTMLCSIEVKKNYILSYYNISFSGGYCLIHNGQVIIMWQSKVVFHLAVAVLLFHMSVTVHEVSSVREELIRSVWYLY